MADGLDTAGRQVHDGRVVAVRPSDVAAAAEALSTWAEFGLAIGPAQHSAVTRALATVYDDVGLSTPEHVLWFGSPLAGTVACALLDPALRSALLPVSEYARQIWADLTAQVGPGVQDLGYAPVRGRVRDQVLHDARAAAEQVIGEEIRRWVTDYVRGGVDDRVSRWMAQPIDRSLRMALAAAVPAELLDRLWQVRLDAAGGQLDAPQVAEVSYLDDLTASGDEDDDSYGIGTLLSPALGALMALTGQIGMWWPLDGIVVLTERAVENQHTDNGWTLTFTDGWQVPTLDELSVPEWVVDAPPIVHADGAGRRPEVEGEALPAAVRGHRELDFLSQQVVTAGVGHLLQPLLGIALPSLRLVGRARVSRPVGKLGGAPQLSADQSWPTHTGRYRGWPRTQRSRPLPFLAQLDLAQLAPLDREGLLPVTGLLTFFFDEQLYLQQLGSSDLPQPEAGWAVLYTAHADVTPRPLPDGIPDTQHYQEMVVEADAELTLPDVHAEAMTVDLDDDEFEFYLNLTDVNGSRGQHRVLGHPELLQGDECGTDVLLLQIDSDDDIGMQWGVGGRLYFFIAPDDLRQARFDRVRCVMQV